MKDNVNILYYRVAGHIFGVEESLAAKTQMDNYSPFVTEQPAYNQALFILMEAPQAPEGERSSVLVSNEGELEPRIDLARIEADGKFTVEMAPINSMPSIGCLVFGENIAETGSGVKLAELYIRNEKFTKFAVDNSLMLLYAFATSTLDTLEMHASVTVLDGKGYLFLGKSGTGKSTHSRLWLKALEGSWLLNDDNPILRFDENGVLTVYGSPWSGKTRCYINRSAPVGAIVNLAQAPWNKISQLGVLEAYAGIYQSCSGLKADRRQGAALHNTIARIATGTLCCKMECLPDEDAARVCHDFVMKK